jgi:hypothetical protein
MADAPHCLVPFVDDFPSQRVLTMRLIQTRSAALFDSLQLAAAKLYVTEGSTG